MIRKDNIDEELAKLANKLSRNGIRAWTRTSKRKVPHVVVQVPNLGMMSICYFLASEKFRVFTDYGIFNCEQETYDFSTEAGVLNYFKQYEIKFNFLDNLKLKLCLKLFKFIINIIPRNSAEYQVLKTMQEKHIL